MNSLYLILIGISFVTGVLVTSLSNDSNATMKPVCEDKKTDVTNDLKALSKEETKEGTWFSFGER